MLKPRTMKTRYLLPTPFALAMFVVIAAFKLHPANVTPASDKLANYAQQGMYLEFNITGSGATGTVKTYSLDGNSRTETEMELAAMQGKKMTIVTVTKQDSPNVVYTLNESNKTYSATNSNNFAGAKPKTVDDYEITVLGNEKVNNYNCTHVKVLNKSTNKQTEMWTSTEVINYASLKTIRNKYIDGSDLFKALEAKGAAGFPVRVTSTDHDRPFQMDLVKAEKREIDNSLFSLDGYTRTASFNTGTNNGSPVYDQQKIDPLKNMTPAERQQYIQDLQKQVPH